MTKHFGLGQLVWMRNEADSVVYGWARVPAEVPGEAIEIDDGEASVIAGPVHTNDRIGPVYQLATASGPVWVRAAMINRLQPKLSQ